MLTDEDVSVTETVGIIVGDALSWIGGVLVGNEVGCSLGFMVGAPEGKTDGELLSTADGRYERVGVPDCISVGSIDGCIDRVKLGASERVKVGEALGTTAVKLNSHPFAVASSCKSHILLLIISSVLQLLGTHQGPVMYVPCTK